MTSEDRKLLAEEIADALHKRPYPRCILGLSPEQARELAGLANGSRLTKRVAGITAIGLLVTAFIAIFCSGLVSKLRDIFLPS